MVVPAGRAATPCGAARPSSSEPTTRPNAPTQASKPTIPKKTAPEICFALTIPLMSSNSGVRYPPLPFSLLLQQIHGHVLPLPLIEIHTHTLLGIFRK